MQTTNVIVSCVYAFSGVKAVLYGLRRLYDKEDGWSVNSLQLKMPGKLRRNEYDLVEEAYDSKSPVHNEDAFEHGIVFRVKVLLIHEDGCCLLPFVQLYS